MIDPPPDVWADARVVVRPSPIEGRGLFAARPVAAGEVVLRLGGRLVTSAVLARMLAAAAAAAAADDDGGGYVDTVAVYPDAHLVLPPGTALHFGNHSCDPSLWFDGPYALAARRAIAAGDELTLDYGTCSAGDGFALDCRCGAAACRGRVTADDWRRPELRQRYGRHWVPVLLARID